jgi:hypothetical protein
MLRNDDFEELTYLEEVTPVGQDLPFPTANECGTEAALDKCKTASDDSNRCCYLEGKGTNVGKKFCVKVAGWGSDPKAYTDAEAVKCEDKQVFPTTKTCGADAPTGKDNCFGTDPTKRCCYAEEKGATTPKKICIGVDKSSRVTTLNELNAKYVHVATIDCGSDATPPAAKECGVDTPADAKACNTHLTDKCCIASVGDKKFCVKAGDKNRNIAKADAENILKLKFDSEKVKDITCSDAGTAFPAVTAQECGVNKDGKALTEKPTSAADSCYKDKKNYCCMVTNVKGDQTACVKTVEKKDKNANKTIAEPVIIEKYGDLSKVECSPASFVSVSFALFAIVMALF